MSMLLHILLSLMYWLGLASDYQVVLALNCGGGSEIKTDLLNYQKDNFFSNNSRSNHKSYLSRGVRDPEERSLLKTDRTASETFVYRLPLKVEGRYGIALKFIQQTHAEVGTRIFNVRLGDDTVMTIDIFKEAGAKRPLIKYFDFELIKDILYINRGDSQTKTQSPVLNGYNYEQKRVYLVFERVKNDPKVEAIVLIRGSIQAFKSRYEQKSQKQTSNTDYLCQKIYRIQDRQHSTIEDPRNFRLKEVVMYSHYINKLISLQGLLSIVIFMLMLYQHEIRLALIRLKQRISSSLQKNTPKPKEN